MINKSNIGHDVSGPVSHCRIRTFSVATSDMQRDLTEGDEERGRPTGVRTEVVKISLLILTPSLRNVLNSAKSS